MQEIKDIETKQIKYFKPRTQSFIPVPPPSSTNDGSLPPKVAGELQKKMVFTGEYASRYIVMDAGHLYYYKDNNRGGSVENKTLKGDIELKNYSILPRDESQVYTFEHT